MKPQEPLDGGRMLPLVEDFYTIQGEGFHAVSYTHLQAALGARCDGYGQGRRTPLQPARAHGYARVGPDGCFRMKN